MKIQIITKHLPLPAENAIEERLSLLQRLVENVQTNTPIALIHSHIIDSTADAYIQQIDDSKLKLGFQKSLSSQFPMQGTNINSDNMHWISIIDSTTFPLDSITKIILFILGIADIPSQFGTFMSDWADLRTASEKGQNAQLIDFHKTTSLEIKEMELMSVVILMNEDLSVNNKFNLITENLSRKILESDFLCILNMSNTERLPRLNWALIINL